MCSVTGVECDFGSPKTQGGVGESEVLLGIAKGSLGKRVGIANHEPY